jgi:hypothetical protein
LQGLAESAGLVRLDTKQKSELFSSTFVTPNSD